MTLWSQSKASYLGPGLGYPDNPLAYGVFPSLVVTLARQCNRHDAAPLCVHAICICPSLAPFCSKDTSYKQILMVRGTQRTTPLALDLDCITSVVSDLNQALRRLLCGKTVRR